MEAALERCDTLFTMGHHVEGLGTIVVHEKDPSPEVQWRLARAIFKEAEFKGSVPKHKAIEASLKILTKNLEIAPDCWNSHVWFAIILGCKEKHESFKQQIEEAFIIREHLDKCIELNPESELAHHVLGQWCYKVASVSWLQKKTAATLFAKPPESTFEEAVSHFKKAEELSPAIFNGNHLCLARTLIDMGRKQEAPEYLKKCLQITEEKKTDKDTLDNIEEAQKLAKKLGLKL
ncbi:regulator of microtubule dynamics protein 1 [Galendromus occidentalis]|uniref:Regulator of microtubule dynamics protein 1 n=1 Tax=Galendromus occidentalis TaxID=34638 RepID=A0AAJ6VV28_9ACAR|nr:regulator of microtubule dynamics protein 1 [Galendromus occidentalis]